MSALEKYPGFDKNVKEELKAAAAQSKEASKPKKALEVAAEKSKAAEKEENGDEEDDDFGMGLFAQAEKEAPKKPASTVVKEAPEDVRTFEYTRAQWTGKSPKQFLIDWVRKHLGKAGPPKFKTNQVINTICSYAIITGGCCFFSPHFVKFIKNTLNNNLTIGK